MTSPTLELPGVEEKDVSVAANDGYPTLRGEKTERTANEDSYHLAERKFGSFERSPRPLAPRTIGTTPSRSPAHGVG